MLPMESAKLKCPAVAHQNQRKWFIGARIFFSQETSLEIQIYVDNPRELVSLNERPGMMLGHWNNPKSMLNSDLFSLVESL